MFGSKAVGEPPLMLAISVREAIRDAVAAFGDGRSGDVGESRHSGARVLRGAARAGERRSAGQSREVPRQ